MVKVKGVKIKSKRRFTEEGTNNNSKEKKMTIVIQLRKKGQEKSVVGKLCHVGEIKMRLTYYQASLMSM